MKISSPGGGIAVELADVLASIDDLELVHVLGQMIREATVREVMRESAEDRKTVTDMIEGEPTTLADALSRYVEMLGDTGEGEETPKALVAEELTAILAYPWPGVPDAEALTREIHESYTRAAPRFGVEVTGWDELEPYQRNLALAVVNDLMARGVLTKRTP